MGKEDINLKTYFKDTRRYADLWNGTVFDGRQLIKAEELETADSTSAVVFANGSGKESMQDVVMKQLRNGECLVTWILENQKEIDYSMPVRIMLHEAMRYAEQVKKIQRRNRLRRKLDAEHKEILEKTGTDVNDVIIYLGRQKVVCEICSPKNPFLNAGEYLYQFLKSDKLVPLTTLVVYWGDKEWDGPKSLHDMLRLYGDSELNDELLKLIPEYPMHIVNLATMDNTEGFRTEVRLLFDLYCRRNNKVELRKYIDEHEECKKMDIDTYHLLKVLIHSEDILLDEDDNEEEMDMCKALRDLIDDSKQEGREEGREGIRLLFQKLISVNRADDITKAIGDKEYCEQLLSEFQIE